MKRLVPTTLLILGLVAVACAPSASPTSSAPPVPTTAAPSSSPSSSAAPGNAVTLNILCRCVANGVNAQTVEWLASYAIPNFEKTMSSQGTLAKVNLVQFGGSGDETVSVRLFADEPPQISGRVWLKPDPGRIFRIAPAVNWWSRGDFMI